MDTLNDRSARQLYTGTVCNLSEGKTCTDSANMVKSND